VVESSVIKVTGPNDARISMIGAEQHGRVARRQLQRAELSNREIDWRIRHGLLIAKHTGVYAIGHDHETEYSRYVAALLTVGPEARVCSHSAAAIEKFRPEPEDGEIHLLVPKTKGGRRRDGIQIHRTADLRHLEPKYIAGVPITRTAYTLLELAADLDRRELERALDEALTLELTTLRELSAVIASNPHSRGVATLEELTHERLVANPTRSVAQEKLLALIRAAGLPVPEGDANIGGGFTADFFWRGAKVASEYDSKKWHKSRSAVKRDKRKDAYCEDHGIELVRVVWEDLEGDPSYRLIARFARLLTARGAWAV
jgi:hypothetical protein